MAEPAPGATLSLQQVSKRFPGVLANDRIDLALYPGEVHVLLGENGAGKSTLAGLLAGLHRPDSGAVLFEGKPVVLDSPAAARALGIAAVQQHSVLVPTLTVAENLVLGAGRGLRRLDRRGAAAQFVALGASVGIAIDPVARAGSLSLGEQRLVEVLRAVWRGSRVLVLDEPTAMLTPAGAQQLLGIMRRSTAAGAAVLFITHKLDEALAIAHRITVLRHGRVAGTFSAETADRSRLLGAMFGGVAEIEEKPTPLAGGGWGRGRAGLSSMAAPPLPPTPSHKGRGGEVLLVQHLSLRRAGRPALLDDISFSIAGGEILGIAGIDGNGQTPLAEVLAGQRHQDGGTVALDGADLGGLGVAARRVRGLRYLTDDRLREGTVGAFPVAVNLLLKRIGAAPFWRHGIARRGTMAAHAARAMAAYDVRAAGPWAPVATLSGGNVQKLLLARELEGTPRLVIYNKPTHGLDALTQAATRRRIAVHAEAGVASLLISPDLEEVFSLAHRIAVMRQGRLLGPLPNEAGARAAVEAMMAGTAA